MFVFLNISYKCIGISWVNALSAWLGEMASSCLVRLRGGLLAVVLVSALVLSGLTALACFTPADRYAVEVVLNRPGVKYDLSKLAELEGVASVEYFGAYSAYAYKSRYDSRLVVVVSEQGLKYVARAPSDEPMTVVSVKGLDISLEQVSVDVEKIRNELGWKVEPVPLPPVPGGRALGLAFTKTIDSAEVRVLLGVLESTGENKGCTVELKLLVKGVDEVSDELASKIKSEIESLLDKIGLPQLKKLLKTHLIKGALARKSPEQEKYVAVRVQIPLKQIVITTTVHACSISVEFNPLELRVEEAKKLGWGGWVKRDAGDGFVGFALAKVLDGVKLRLEGKGAGGEVHLSLRVEGAGELSATVLGEFKEALKAIGLDEGLVDKCSFQRFEESRGSKLAPAYDVSEEDLKEALRVELKWLLENGVISDLSEDDVEAIVSAARLGYAGWNSRLVWFNGRWTSYYSTEGAMVLKCVGAVPAFFFPEEELGWPETQGTGQSPSLDVGCPPWNILCLAVAFAAALVAAALSYLVLRRRMAVKD